MRYLVAKLPHYSPSLFFLFEASWSRDFNFLMHSAKYFFKFLNKQKKKRISSSGQNSPVCLKISPRSSFVLLFTCSFVLFAPAKVFYPFFPLNSSHHWVGKLKLPFTLQLPASKGLFFLPEKRTTWRRIIRYSIWHPTNQRTRETHSQLLHLSS